MNFKSLDVITLECFSERLLCCIINNIGLVSSKFYALQERLVQLNIILWS